MKLKNITTSMLHHATARLETAEGTTMVKMKDCGFSPYYSNVPGLPSDPQNVAAVALVPTNECYSCSRTWKHLSYKCGCSDSPHVKASGLWLYVYNTSASRIDKIHAIGAEYI